MHGNVRFPSIAISFWHVIILIPNISILSPHRSIGYGAAAAEHQAIATLNHAIDIGCNFWDTADMYGNNEELLAKVLKTRRNEVFLASKFGMRFNPEDPPNSKVDGTPEYVKEACDRSLKRLGVKHIDLYYQHRVDPNT